MIEQQMTDMVLPVNVPQNPQEATVSMAPDNTPIPETFAMPDLTNFEIDPEIMQQFIEMQANMQAQMSAEPQAEAAPIPTVQAEPVIEEIVDEAPKEVNFEALADFITDKDVIEITYHNHGKTFIKSLVKGVEEVKKDDINDDFVFALAQDLAHNMGTTFDEENPLLVVNNPVFKISAIHPTRTNNGISLTLRRRSEGTLSDEEIQATNYAPVMVMNLLKTFIKGNINIAISGTAGSGKTELLKYLIKSKEDKQKIVFFDNNNKFDESLKERSVISIKKDNDIDKTCDLINVEAPDIIVISLVEKDDIEILSYALSSGFTVMMTVNSKRADLIPIRLYNLNREEDISCSLENYYNLLEIGIHLNKSFDKENNTFKYEIVEVIEYLADRSHKIYTNTIYEKTDKGRYKLLSKELVNKLIKEGVDLEAIEKLVPKGMMPAKVETLEKPVQEETKEEETSPVLKVPEPVEAEVFQTQTEKEKAEAERIKQESEAMAKEILGL